MKHKALAATDIIKAILKYNINISQTSYNIGVLLTCEQHKYNINDIESILFIMHNALATMIFVKRFCQDKVIVSQSNFQEMFHLLSGTLNSK